MRNSKIVDIFSTLEEYTNNITVFDPWANIETVKREYGITITNECPIDTFDAIILGVSHRQFLDIDILSLLKENGVVYDVKVFYQETLLMEGSKVLVI